MPLIKYNPGTRLENIYRLYTGKHYSTNGSKIPQLYVDYNTTRGRWECKPYPIYKPDYNDGFTRTISYRAVYESVPTLLIHENQLDLMRMNINKYVC